MKNLLLLLALLLFVPLNASLAQNHLLARDGQAEGLVFNNSSKSVSQNSTLVNDTGNQSALELNYTTNKSTSGDDIGILITNTDTASPGQSYLIKAVSNSSTKFVVDNVGSLVAYGSISTNILNPTANDTTLAFITRDYTVADVAVDMCSATDVTNSSGQFTALQIRPTYNQSGTASSTDLLINRTETAVGSGAQYLIDAQVGTISKFSVDNKGTIKNTGARIVNVTDVNASTYDLSTTDNILHVSYTSTAAVDSLTLPTAQCDGIEDNGRIITIKDSGGNASTNTITIDTEGAETIDANATLVMNSNYASVDLYCYSSNWYIR